MSELGALVAKRRSGLGLSLQQVADRAGLTKGHVWEIEQGAADNLRVNTIVGLASGLQLSAVAIFRAAIGLSPAGYHHVTTGEE